MIYLDTSVLLAQLLAEDRTPPGNLWSEDLVSSRLLEYEVLNRIYARGLLRSHGESARSILDGVAMVQMISPVLARALEPFPVPVRTLDALHLATMEFLRSHSVRVELASYDARMVTAARKLKIPIRAL
jgi:predicted nucleic acid-binding protein